MPTISKITNALAGLPVAARDGSIPPAIRARLIRSALRDALFIGAGITVWALLMLALEAVA